MRVICRSARTKNGGELMEKAPVPKGTETFTTAAPLPPAAVILSVYLLSACRLPTASALNTANIADRFHSPTNTPNNRLSRYKNSQSDSNINGVKEKQINQFATSF